MQKATGVIILLAAAIIAGGLWYHARVLAGVSEDVNDLRKQNASLEARMAELNRQLPNVGRDAGHEAVQGIIDEVVEKPLELLSRYIPGASDGGVKVALKRPPGTDRPGASGGALFHLEISQPFVHIELVTDVKGLPSFSWPAETASAATQEAAAKPSTGATGKATDPL